MSTPNIYDRWDDAAPFERLLFRSDRILQSAEMFQSAPAIAGGRCRASTAVTSP